MPHRVGFNTINELTVPNSFFHSSHPNWNPDLVDVKVWRWIYQKVQIALVCIAMAYVYIAEKRRMSSLFLGKPRCRFCMNRPALKKGQKVTEFNIKTKNVFPPLRLGNAIVQFLCMIFRLPQASGQICTCRQKRNHVVSAREHHSLSPSSREGICRFWDICGKWRRCARNTKVTIQLQQDLKPNPLRLPRLPPPSCPLHL